MDKTRTWAVFADGRVMELGHGRNVPHGFFPDDWGDFFIMESTQKPEGVDQDEHQYYWTLTAQEGACDQCRAMEGIRFPREPERPHPNCRCEITKHLVQSDRWAPGPENTEWVFSRGYLTHVSGKGWPAVSGPLGKGRLPEGVYAVGQVHQIPNDGNEPFCDSSGNCWWCGIKPLFDTSRGHFGIHPDGHDTGTHGCIGIIGRDTSGIREFLKRNGGTLRVK